MTLTRDDKTARKTDTDSGIHSVGSGGSWRGLEVTLSEEIYRRRVRRCSWRDNLLEVDPVRRHSERHDKISRLVSEMRSRSQDHGERRRSQGSGDVSRRSRSYNPRAQARVSGQRLSLISSHHHIPRVFLSPHRDNSIQSASSPASTEDEDALSLAFIQNNAVIHQYVASRGQREKEIEIYEVLPSTIKMSKHRHKSWSSYTISSS